MLPTASTYTQAQKAAQIMCHILVNEMKLQYPQRFLLIEHGRFVWLLANMDDLNLGGSMSKYIHNGTLHRLSTALDGLPVYLSNHSGLRYAVLLSDRPQLAESVDFPAPPLDENMIPLGMGLAGPVHVHAGQIVNMILVGAQDSGKSMALRALAHAARLHGSHLYLADPVSHTFNPDLWNRVSAYPVVHSVGQFVKMLEHLNHEIQQRSEAFRDIAQGGIPPEDLDAYNKIADEPLPRVWMIADEANTFLASKAVQQRMADPARIGRKFGIHLVLAGHDWHEYTVNRGLTGFFETRLCLRTSNDTTGRIVLDDSARGKRTMRFRQPGRAILRLRGQYQDVQLYFVAPDLEREWFSGIEPSDEHMQQMAEQVEARDDAPSIPDEIIQLADSIRSDWSPELSKRAVGRLMDLQYAGSYVTKIDAVIAYLSATTTTKGSDSPGFSPNMAM